MRIRPSAVFGAIGLSLIAISGWGSDHGPGQSDAPRLIVLISVDQLRGDLLAVYRPLFSDGLRRLLDEGQWFPNARIEHAPSNSMPGHVTLATGMNPRHHGIVDNSFVELGPDGRGRLVSALEDSTVQIVGAPAEEGVSPRRLQVDALVDWILAANEASRAIVVSANEYGALLHAGRGRERRAVYWFSPGAGKFVTSTFYDTIAPPWLSRTNASLPSAIVAESSWTTIVPLAMRHLALPDSAAWEYDHVHTAFPHRWPAERDADWRPTQPRWLYFTPFPDSVTLAMAANALETTALGRGPAVDYLSVTLAGSDGIGHWYGPRSLEQLDNLLRLDRELGTFLRTLDRTVGRGRYTLALSADHGVVDIPEAPAAPAAMAFGATTGNRVSDAQLDSLFQELAASAPRGDSGMHIAMDIVRRRPYVAAVYQRAALADSNAAPSDSFETFYRNSWHPTRVPIFPMASRYGTMARYGLVARLQPGTVVGEVPAEHGTAYDYDRRVALLFFGAGVSPGVNPGPARTVDVAATLAAIARMQPPHPLDGRPLLSLGR